MYSRGMPQLGCDAPPKCRTECCTAKVGEERRARGLGGSEVGRRCTSTCTAGGCPSSVVTPRPSVGQSAAQRKWEKRGGQGAWVQARWDQCAPRHVEEGDAPAPVVTPRPSVGQSAAQRKWEKRGGQGAWVQARWDQCAPR